MPFIRNSLPFDQECGHIYWTSMGPRATCCRPMDGHGHDPVEIEDLAAAVLRGDVREVRISDLVRYGENVGLVD